MTMRIKNYLFCLIAFGALHANSVCLFSPPKNWQAAKPKNLSEYVQIGFVGQGSDSFSPSISLATEAVDCSLRDYVQAVKEIQLCEPNTHWRDLGALEMNGGKGRLIQITSPSSWGDLTVLQAMLVKENVAYILTASMLKKDLPSLQKEVLASLRSMEFATDLFAVVKEDSLRTQLIESFNQLGEKSSEEQNAKEWSALQSLIEKETNHLGAYWQFLALREGYAKIHSRTQQ
ncbi:MAG TPA: hypothetical protein VGM34_03455 [Chlamydiales bacterium]